MSTYFNRHNVITSSDAGIRARNNIQGEFDPGLWPYDPSGGPNKTKSRGTLFRIYGFAPEHAGKHVQDANDYSRQYEIVGDSSIPGAYYIDLGGPAEVYIPVSYLQRHLTGSRDAVRPWTLPGTQKLGRDKLNVPGITLNHNVGVVHLPPRILQQLDTRRVWGLLDYVGVQLWGNGNPKFREFVDVEVQFVYDAVDHEKYGFRTAVNTNYEGFSSCNYLDFAAGNDTARFNDVWAGHHAGHQNYGPACGHLEKAQNQKVRANYDVPFDSIQLLPSVNVHNDTTRIYYGEIRTRDSEESEEDEED